MKTSSEKAIAKKNWNIANKEHVKEYAKTYREKNKEKLNKKKRDNPDYHRNLNLKRNYNFSLDEYNDMLEKQNGRCLGCNSFYTESARERLHVDHCHLTGKIRGLLCHHCNTALGLVKDNIDTLSRLISYLKTNSNN